MRSRLDRSLRRPEHRLRIPRLSNARMNLSTTLASLGDIAGARALSERVVQALEKALGDEDRDVQLTAVRALGKLRRADPLLDVVTAARDPALVASALRALGDADADQAFAAARPPKK